MNDNRSVAVILAAAGKSTRFADDTDEPTVKKPFALLLGKPVWLHSAERFRLRDDVGQLVIVVSAEDLEWFRQYYAEEINRLFLVVVPGGEERVDSVRNALGAVGENVELVVVHDAARPCIRNELINVVFEKARSAGAALPASPVFGTVKRVQDDRIEETVSRDRLWEAQTPQVFQRKIIFDAFARYDVDSDVGHDGAPVTDDASLVERAGYPVYIVPSDCWNLKITTQTDLTVAEMVLSAQNKKEGDDSAENMDYITSEDTVS